MGPARNDANEVLVGADDAADTLGLAEDGTDANVEGARPVAAGAEPMAVPLGANVGDALGPEPVGTAPEPD